MQGKGKSIYMNRAQHDLKRRRQLRNWAILIAVVVAVFVALRLLQSVGTTREITVTQLPCYATQSITPFGQDVLYYDGASIHCDEHRAERQCAVGPPLAERRHIAGAHFFAGLLCDDHKSV